MPALVSAVSLSHYKPIISPLQDRAESAPRKPAPIRRASAVESPRHLASPRTAPHSFGKGRVREEEDETPRQRRETERISPER